VLDQDSNRFYRGRSMLGTFRLGDRLALTPMSTHEVRPGDVVVFRGPNHRDGEDELVHRIVAGTPEGWVARGDSNPCADATLVTAENLLGRVTHVERGGRSWPVHGGRRGLLRARILHVWRRLSRYAWRWTVRLGRGPYRRLRSCGLVGRLWRPEVSRVRLNTEEGPLVKYVCGRRTVARWWPQEDRFECRRPYDLVIPRPDGAQGWEGESAQPPGSPMP
jgi:hypothetical protein